MAAGRGGTSVNGSGSTMADLNSLIRRTTGQRPPPLVGCSISILNDCIIVFGGRLVPTRTMVNTIYSLNVVSLVWTLFECEISPVARYFHSCEVFGNKLIIFGGEGYNEGNKEPESTLITLNDVILWDSITSKWEFPIITHSSNPVQPRYAHLATITQYYTQTTPPKLQSLMIIMGGQDLSNSYLHSINVLNLDTMTWINSAKWDKNIGTYRAIAATPKYTIIPSSQEFITSSTKSQTKRLSSRPATPLRNSSTAGDLAEAELGLENNEVLQTLAYSTLPTQENPEPILIFSNFNFTDVRRDFDSLSSPILLSSTAEATPTNSSSSSSNGTIKNLSGLESTSLARFMTGPALPPGLRFPTGTIIGNHLILFGTFLSQTVNNFSIWSLNLGKAGASGILGALQGGGEKGLLEWKKIEGGSGLSKGSWNRAVGYGNSIVVLGDRERDIAEDYDHRQTNFAHVAFIDLESFGIYQPPPSTASLEVCKLGLATLSHTGLADFEIICAEGKRIACSRKLLESRWPWFKLEMASFAEKAKGLLRGREAEELKYPRSFIWGESFGITQSWLQYLYTFSLCTPLQLQLNNLIGLLALATNYKEENLKSLVVHALHESLGKENWTAASIYEAATLNGCTGLQIRALRAMMNGSRNRPSVSS